MSVNYVGIVYPELEGNPSCHICGAVMVKRGTRMGKPKKHENDGAYDCLSCGNNTECACF